MDVEGESLGGHCGNVRLAIRMGRCLDFYRVHRNCPEWAGLGYASFLHVYLPLGLRRLLVVGILGVFHGSLVCFSLMARIASQMLPFYLLKASSTHRSL